jgi:hypothetical protein
LLGADETNAFKASASGLATAWDPSGKGGVRAPAFNGLVVNAGGPFTTLGGQAGSVDDPGLLRTRK